MSTSPVTSRTEPQHPYRQLSVRHDPAVNALWVALRPQPRPCFNPDLLDECRTLQRQLTLSAQRWGKPPADYLVLGSATPTTFSLGGDLELFLTLIRAADGDGLRRYAKACIDVSYHQAISLDLPLTTIALVQGDALGGGFEAALSCNVLVAEKQAQLGLPEVLFNLFPGMGAYSFLTRRLDPARAERLILSGELYPAEELYRLGIVDVLAEPGGGEQAVLDYIAKRQRSPQSYSALQQIRNRQHPVDYDELLGIAELWVSAALQLQPRDLKMMERLVRAQNRRAPTPDAGKREHTSMHPAHAANG